MHIMKKQVLLIILLALPLWLKAADVSVTGLRTEQMVDPMGLDTAVPRMSWRLESSQRNVMQTAYRILVASSPELLAQDKGDLWDSGKVESDASVWIPYEGKRLKSNQRVYWKVRSYNNRGETEWSEPARWGMGPLGEIHWGGRWIGWDAAFAWDREDSHSRLSSRYLRTEFKTQAKEIKYATLHLCGLGMYELFINGQRIGDQVLAPAPSDYRRTVLYNSFDVTKQVAGGNADNAIGVTLGNGRFYTMRQNYKPYKIPTFGYPKLRLNLIIEYTDGSIQRINSDEKWRLTAQGPIRSNNEYDGEIYDARMELGNWTQPGYDDSKWLKAQRVSLPYGTLRGNTAPNMKVMKTLKPAVFKQYGNRYMIDFGQNMAGWVRINIAKAAAGDTICIRYAERVKNDGTELDVENLRHSQSTDYYICNGKENNTSWSSRFSYHGFQYVEVTGYKNLKAEDLVAEVVYDDLEDNGTFECSNDIMNRVYRNAWWGISSNYKGVPLDCPQRDERQPWLGDHAMGTWGESFMFNNGNTYAKWADDIREAQREDGCIPDICPAYYNYYTSEMTWSSTFPVICDMVYEQFGNIEPIRKNYAAIKKWMHHIRSEFTTEDGVINADKYGDWCMPPESPELIHSQDPARKTDGALIATAYYYKVSQMLAKFARLQGLEDEAKEFEKDAAKIKDCFNARFLTVKKGTSPVQMPHVLYPDSIFYGNNTVTANILPLAFDMVPEAYREEVEKNVITGIITRNKGHISSGVIGMNWMMRELTRMGRGDVAFLLASNKTYPSYGYMIEKGATAIWELWNGDTANRWMNSCNHVMILGDLLTWYFRDLAGFNPAQPAYKQIIFKPDFSIHVPQVIEELERSVEEIKNKKKEAVKQQNFEVAAAFRDKERQLLAQLEQEKDNWQKELKENRVVVDEESVAEVVAMMTGVPVKRIAKTEGMKLLQMREELADSVVGQQEAIEKIVKAIHRNRAGLKDPNRPIGSFIFLGPTGVGKTQLAKVLAQYLFDTPDSLIRIDMSEYMEKFAVSRLVGAPPGYVGYEEGGQLTEKVRRKPYSVVLLDEIEKAHPDVFNILLQLLDDGQLTDSLGRRVDFKNTIVIMTSNIGSRQLKDFGRGIGFMAADKTNDNDYAKSVVQKALKSAFSPEFLNRIDDVIVFNPLSKEDIHKIIDIELKGLLKRVGELGYHIQVSDAAKEFLTEKGYDPQYGARPLKRAIQKYLEDELASSFLLFTFSLSFSLSQST